MGTKIETPSLRVGFFLTLCQHGNSEVLSFLLDATFWSLKRCVSPDKAAVSRVMRRNAQRGEIDVEGHQLRSGNLQGLHNQLSSRINILLKNKISKELYIPLWEIFTGIIQISKLMFNHHFQQLYIFF